MATDKELRKLQDRIDNLEYEHKQMKEQVRDLKKENRSISNKLETRIKREKELRQILQVVSRNRKGEKTVIRELLDKTDSNEEYLLNTTKRVENALSAIKTHREYIIKLNKRVFTATPREIMMAELGVMNNTLGILSLNGIKVSQSLIKDINNLEEDLEDEKAKVGELTKKKEELQERFQQEIEKYDLSSIFSKKKEIYGYR